MSEIVRTPEHLARHPFGRVPVIHVINWDAGNVSSPHASGPPPPT
jgi:hypothetical protein